MRTKPVIQYIASFLSVVAVTLLCYLSQDLIGYRTVALILLVMVSILAMLFDIWPVLMAAMASAFLLNFLFIPPKFTLHIFQTEDILLFMMYLLVAMVNAVLTHKLKKHEKTLRDREEKEKAIRLYNILFNSLSHELKTPISTIIGAAETLNENSGSMTTETKSTLLSEIKEAGYRLDRQVANLLHMSRLESGMLQVKKDWCDLNDIIHQAMNKFSPADRTRIRFVADQLLPFYKVDYGLIDLVIYNLLHNAIQYTPADKPVYIETHPKEDGIDICIADQGPGFPQETIPLVFDKFYRLPDSRTGGTGLGLSIAKGFTEAHGGTLSLRNRPEGGAEFTMFVPAETSFMNQLKNE